MSLFQPSVLKKYLNDLDKEKLSAAWKVFQSNFHNAAKQENIRNAKEEQYQEGFLRELFVAVFNYTLNPDPHFNLITEQKNEKDSKKADGAILSPSGGGTGEVSVRAVIELKGTDTTDLGKIETQAFGYLHNQKGCTYVITSNFEKLRFYITDATDYIEFNLFTLDEAEFAKLYLCLQKDSLLADVPLQMKQQSIAQEDVITKKLYADYSTFKQALYQNLVALNPQYDQLELFKKTQKLLDRFLFILFAEDRLLLPPNFIIKIVEEYKQLQKLRVQQSLYERCKVYFTDLLDGNKDEDIFAYNGGLFEPDDVLDNLKVDDAVLMPGILSLSHYDYNSDVDVNILGHIFEHSLNELEQLQASLENTAVDKNKTRRKKEGVFYTPRYITKYIVENTVGALCAEKKTEFEIVEEDYAPDKRKRNKKALLEKLDDYREWLLQITICDPACGSGAFLNAALEFLIKQHSYIDELTAKLLGHTMQLPWTPNDILEHNLFGVDINEEAVEIARLSLWLRTAQKGRKLSNLSNNIKCGNSLIDDTTVAGDKAFNWKEEFKEVFSPSLRGDTTKQSGFDVVIGNPPYGAEFKKAEVDFLEKKYDDTIEYQLNSYVVFYQKGIEILRSKGILGFITPATFSYQHYFKKLRTFLQRFKTLNVNKFFYEVFEDADIGDSVIWITSKETADFKSVGIKLTNSKNEKDYLPVEREYTNFVNNDGTFNLNRSGFSFNTYLNYEYRLDDAAEIIVGIKPYQVGKGVPKQTREIVESKVFTSDRKRDETYINCVIGKDFFRYTYLNTPSMYLSYGKWLAEPRESAPFFNSEKIILRQTSDSLIGHLDSEQKINLNNVYNVGKKDEQIELKYLLVLLNSKFLNFIYQAISQEKGRLFAEVKRVNLAKLPIKKLSKIDQQPFIDKADMMLSKNKELHSIKQSLLQLLAAKYEGITISKKLSDWSSLSFKEFLKELEKQKIKLSLTEQNEWLNYFETEKQKATQLQSIIDATDKEIDNMVYQLYGLTEEEIKIVEGV